MRVVKIVFCLHSVIHCNSRDVTPRGIHRRLPELLGIHLAKALISLDRDLLGILAARAENFFFFNVIVCVEYLLVISDLIEWRHREIYVALSRADRHIAVEKVRRRESDVRAVDIGISHDDYFMIAKFCDIELGSYSGAEALDNWLKLIVADYFIDSRLLDIKHLAPEGRIA
jgi:hypothetical protein